MTALAGVTVVFRADASLEIGTGHVMRCLTLAEALRQQGATCRFVSRSHAGNRIDTIRARGFEVAELPVTGHGAPAFAVTRHDGWLGSDWRTDAQQTAAALGGGQVDWLIVDHYALEMHWESALRPHVRHILAIDDLADRRHDCDLLLDQNLGRVASHYAALVPEGCRVLAGPQFALLRPQFAALRAASLARRDRPTLEHLLISMGGIDAGNATGAVLDALRQCRLPADLHISVVMGGTAPALAAVREAAAGLPWHTEVLVDVEGMAALMASSDLAIGAAGSTAWERCCLGLPSVVVALADNQRDAAGLLQGAGAAVCVDLGAEFAASLQQALARVASGEPLVAMSLAARRITDGAGCGRVVADILRLQEHRGPGANSG
jgi:UDP-2,4-diacetamido-2,4,6-trideoxy-beta-L-altropyranose hydrolase